jgi:hypothetical protein
VGKMNDLDASQLSLLASSLARLNVRNDARFDLISKRFLELDSSISEVEDVPPSTEVGARVVTLVAYAFAKLRPSSTNTLFQNKIVSLSKDLIRDFTAKELQMLTTALDRWNIQDLQIYSSISGQAQRRIAQFSSETLIHLLRVFANRSIEDHSLMSRVICQLPRISQTLKSNEIVAFWTLFRDMKIRSPVAIEVLRPLTVTRSGMFSVNDWLSILDSCATVGNESSNQEIIDAFVMINELPAKYKGTLTPVSSTVVEKLSTGQIIDVLKSIKSMKLNCSRNVAELITRRIDIEAVSASDASDIYCSLVALGCHENTAMNHLMTRLMCRAIQV